MYRRDSTLKVAWFLLVFMTIGTFSFTFHSHQELVWNEYYLSDIADIKHSISADTDYCPVCLFLLETDLLERSFDGAAFHLSEQLSIPIEVIPFSAFEFIVKGRSPPSVI